MEYTLEYIINDEVNNYYMNKDEITIGKLSGNDLHLNDNSVSRSHCKFVKTKDTYKIVDKHSTNGTYVNGKRITDKKLEVGDNITIGRTILKYMEIEKLENPIKEYTDVDDQKISMVIPLSDKIHLKEEKQAEIANLRFLTALTALGKDLISATSLEDSFGKVGDLIFDFMSPKRMFIFFYDQQLEDLDLKYSRTNKGGPVEKVNISRSIAMKALREKVAILSANAMDDDRFDGAKSIIMYGITSAISVPIWTKNSIYGLIYLDTTEFVQIFKESDLDILSVIANFVGLSIEGINSLNKLNREKKIRARLERYHSPAVVSRIMEGHESSTLEMNTYKETEATVFFMDIVGFTTKVEHMNPMEIGVFLNNFFTQMTDVIFTNNGTLDKYIGDCIMAVFGVPFKIEGHAEQAIRAAIDIMDKLEKMNKDFPKKDQVKIRIGINSGKLVAGDFGAPRRLDYTVIGNTVNIASRLESSVAEANSIVISEYTYNLTGDLFKCKFLGDKKLQGLSQSVKAYEVLTRRKS